MPCVSNSTVAAEDVDHDHPEGASNRLPVRRSQSNRYCQSIARVHASELLITGDRCTALCRIGDSHGSFITSIARCRHTWRAGRGKNALRGAKSHPTAAASAGFAAAAGAGAGDSEAMSARLMVTCRVGEVILAPNRSVT